MSCVLNTELLQKYPQQAFAVFMSSGENIDTKTDAEKDLYISDNHVGYLIELDRLGQAADAPGTTANNDLDNKPYSTMLRPVTDTSIIYEAQKVLVESIEFFAYDLKNANSETQDSNVVTAIIDSRTANNAYAQNTMFNTLINVNWQPNFFRPSVRINDVDLFQGIQSSQYGNHRNKGDLSIGMPIPMCRDIYREFGKIRSISAFAQVAQAVKVPEAVDYKYQRYGVMMILSFRTGTGTVEVRNG